MCMYAPALPCGRLHVRHMQLRAWPCSKHPCLQVAGWAYESVSQPGGNRELGERCKPLATRAVNTVIVHNA